MLPFLRKHLNFLFMVDIWLPTDALVSLLGQLLTLLLIWPLTFLTQTAGTATTPLPPSLREPLSPSYWPQVRLYWSQVCFQLLWIHWFTFWIHPLVYFFMAGEEQSVECDWSHQQQLLLKREKYDFLFPFYVVSYSIKLLGTQSVSSSLQRNTWTYIAGIGSLFHSTISWMTQPPSCHLLYALFLRIALILDEKSIEILKLDHMK